MNLDQGNSENIIAQMGKTKILVIGDIMLDRFIYGTADRISPESPVPVLSISHDDIMLGGAGNTLSNLIHLGVEGHVISIIGDDQNGTDLINQAEQLNINTANLIKTDERPTITKTRFLAGHQQLLRSDFESKAPLSQKTITQIVTTIQNTAPSMDAIIISDYGKGTLSHDIISTILSTAKQHKLPIFIDPKGTDYSIYRGANFITPNKKELSEATNNMPTETDQDIISAAQFLIDTHDITCVIATRSQDGISIIEKNKDPIHIKSAVNIEVFDVSGAGDTVIATIAAAYAAGATIEEATNIANIAGSIVVTKVGTAPIRASELHERLCDDAPINPDDTRDMIMKDWHLAQEKVQRWRARGLKVGFTNGCFDILHYGHVTYLQDARKKCDRLIIGLNYDASIRMLKGEERPVHDEDARAAVLAALGAVDMVVFFGAEKNGDDNTACALLDVIKPHIYFKGGDYTIDQIPEAPTVQKHGGTIDVMPVYEGHSTTSSIEKIKKQQN